jgi:hypothetical protein
MAGSTLGNSPERVETERQLLLVKHGVLPRTTHLMTVRSSPDTALVCPALCEHDVGSLQVAVDHTCYHNTGTTESKPQKTSASRPP